MIARDKAELEARLKRIGGQVGGIQRMLDEERPLLDVLTQLAAVRAALDGVTNIVVAAHVEARVNTVLSHDSPRERLDFAREIATLVRKM